MMLFLLSGLSLLSPLSLLLFDAAVKSSLGCQCFLCDRHPNAGSLTGWAWFFSTFLMAQLFDMNQAFLTSSQFLPFVEYPELLTSGISSSIGRAQARGSSFFAFCESHLICGKLTDRGHVEQQTCYPVIAAQQASCLQNSSGKKQAAVSISTQLSKLQRYVVGSP